MRVLAMDVSITGCSVSLFDTETNFSCVRREATDRGQAEMLVPMIADMVAESGFTVGDMNCIAVTRGPGSFTGVRIGLATARSLGLALNIPVIGIPTLDAIAQSYPEDKDSTLFLIDTKRGDYYGQVGSKQVGSELGDTPRIWSDEDVAAFVGTIVKDALPDIMIVARMACDVYAGMDPEFRAQYNIATAPAPIYVRGAEVSQPKVSAIPRVL
mgnify:CR=1 FL=1